MFLTSLNFTADSSLVYLADSIQLPTNLIWMIPLISALIGWFTNYLAVKMLFHPKTPFVFLGFIIQGIFPKRQTQLAGKLGIIVAQELISAEQLTDKIKFHVSDKDFMGMLEKKIENTIRNKLVTTFPMLSMFLSDEMVEKVTNLFRNDLEIFISEAINQLSSKINEELNVQEMVSRKVENFPSEKLEEILMSLMKKEFKFIEVIGALLGFLIGCFQVGLTLSM